LVTETAEAGWPDTRTAHETTPAQTHLSIVRVVTVEVFLSNPRLRVAF